MTSAYPDVEGQLYTTGVPDAAYTEAEARQRAASRREDAATASAAGASALADAKAYTDERTASVALTADDDIDTLTPGPDYWVLSSAVAQGLGMPEAVHGVLRVHKWDGGRGVTLFVTRTMPARVWSLAYNTSGTRDGGWTQVTGDYAGIDSRLTTVEADVAAVEADVAAAQPFRLLSGTPTWDQLPDGTHYIINSAQVSSLGLPVTQHGLLVKRQSSASAGGAWFFPRSGEDFMWRRQFSSTGWGAWEKVQSGSGAGAGVEEVSGVVTLGASGPAYRQFYTLAQTNFVVEGTDAAVMIPPSQAVAWRRDAHGQWGYQKAADAWIAPPSFPDSVVPGAGSLSTSMSSTSAYLSVSGATDDRGIAFYEFSKDGGASWTPPTPDPSYRFVELTRATEYQFRHRVTDTSGNTAVGAIVTRSTL